MVYFIFWVVGFSLGVYRSFEGTPFIQKRMIWLGLAGNRYSLQRYTSLPSST